jgi:protein dithiol oxidoreductase (disulfide-forming)
MDAQADFLATQGVDKRKFIDTYYSVSMQAQLWQANTLFADYHIDTVPTLVVARRYKITLVNNGVDGIATVDYLVKQVLDKKL